MHEYIYKMIGNTDSFVKKKSILIKACKAFSMPSPQIAGLLIHMILFSDRHHQQMTVGDSCIRLNEYVVIHPP